MSGFGGRSAAVEILLVEDSPGDARLVEEAFKDGKVANRLTVVGDGVEAMAFLRREGDYADAPRPDIILLDLNMPRKDGRETLKEIKSEPSLKNIPVCLLTTGGAAEQDIVKSYNLQANCYIAKPVDAEQFFEAVKAIEDFWFCVVKLPPHSDAGRAVSPAEAS